MNNQFIKEVKEYVSLCEDVRKIEEGLGNWLGRLFGGGYTDGTKQVLGKMQDVYKSDNALINQARDILVRTLQRRQKKLKEIAPKLIQQIENSNADADVVANVKKFINAKTNDVQKSIKVIQDAIQQIKALGEPTTPPQGAAPAPAPAATTAPAAATTTPAPATTPGPAGTTTPPPVTGKGGGKGGRKRKPSAKKSATNPTPPAATPVPPPTTGTPDEIEKDRERLASAGTDE